MMTTLLVRMVATVVYALVVSLTTMLVSRGIGEPQSGGSHDAAVRAMVSRPSERLTDIGGLYVAKRDLFRRVVLPMRRPDVFYEHPNLHPPNAVLLQGPPGTGKTTLARALAAESGVRFLAMHAANLESKWWGETPKLLESAFRLAATELAPCIIFFDEIDGIGRARSEADQSCVYQLKCELLRNMDAVRGAPVIVLGCTNCASSLDPALRRRFSRTVCIGLPNEEERYEILCKLEGRRRSKVLRHVSRSTEGLSGADLVSLHTEAAMRRMDNLDEQTLRCAASGMDLVRSLGPISSVHWGAARAHLWK